jgi:hypothetical protein
MRTALLDLVWLMFYLTIMRLLGFRLSRQRPRPNPNPNSNLGPKPTPAPAGVTPSGPVFAAPAKPRCRHRIIDRQMCIEALVRINGAFAPNAEAAPAEPAQAAPCPPVQASHPRACSAPWSEPAGNVAPVQPSPLPRRPRAENAAKPTVQTLVHFVAIS